MKDNQPSCKNIILEKKTFYTYIIYRFNFILESVAVGKNLSLYDVTCESSGTYTCTASNNVGKAAYHDIQVAVCKYSLTGLILYNI